MTEPRHIHMPGERAVLYVAIFLLGGIVMAFEMLASRYLNPFFGSSIYTWGSLISVVLAGMTCGYYFGGRLADRYPSAATFAMIIVPAPVLLALLPMFAEPVALSLAQTDLDVRVGVLAASMGLFFLPVALLSAASPFAIRLLLSTRERGGSTAGTVIAVSTAGSIAGTLGTVFYLIPTFGTRAITYGLAVASAAAIVIILAPRLFGRTRAASAAAVVLLLLAIAPNVTHASSLAQLREHLVEEKETPYNQIYVFKQGDYATMRFGLYERRFTESISNARDPRDLPVPYTQALTLGAACPREAKTTLMIGLGGGSTVRYLAQFMPDTDFTTVEIDPGVIQMAQKYFDVHQTPHQHIVEKDARLYLNGVTAKYDLIFVDAYRGAFVPFHLTTQEFYALAKSHLTPGGCLLQNVDPSTLLFDSVMATMSKVFANVETLPARGNIVVIAYDRPKRDANAWLAAAAATQQRYKFAYDLSGFARAIHTMAWNHGAAPLTDDFAPAEILNMEDPALASITACRLRRLPGRGRWMQ